MMSRARLKWGRAFINMDKAIQDRNWRRVKYWRGQGDKAITKFTKEDVEKLAILRERIFGLTENK